MSDVMGQIDEYLEKNWEKVVADIDRVVRIPSVEDKEHATEAEPFGPEPARALAEALDIAKEMGFETKNVDNYMGLADFPGETETQIGIIGHMDVVPAGQGWNFPPYEVTRKEGYLVGRGTIDDKGPSIVALHAVNFWKEAGAKFPYTVRFMFGANEESGMRDVEYYQERYEDPAFLFTPDADFPVCYGEKGCYDGLLTFAQPEGAVIVELEGGMATNAVPGFAHAVVRANLADLPAAERITLSEAGEGLVRIDAEGKSAHASLPATGINAIGLVVDYLLENHLYTEAERPFLEMEQKLLNHTDGSGLGVACEDPHFGALTLVGGTVKTEDGKIMQTFDSRYPTTMDSETFKAKAEAFAKTGSCTFEELKNVVPFLVEPDSPVIQALLSAYNEATGEDAKPFTMGGGTYARHFKAGASFGPEMSWVKNPEWVGGMHGPDEAISEEQLKQAFRIYVLTIEKLMQLDL